MAISYPPIFINQYLKEKINEWYQDQDSGQRFDFSIPFFPVSPSDIDQLTETFPEGMYCVFDRMFKFRRTPFPHIKCEQLLYYFYKMSGDPELLIEVTQKVHDWLDRGDESAQELNAWIESKVNQTTKLVTFGSGNLAKDFKPVFFHDLKVYQLEETRDIIDFGTARTYAGNKVIIDYDYHTKDYS
jgi:hypothetical protein